MNRWKKACLGAGIYHGILILLLYIVGIHYSATMPPSQKGVLQISVASGQGGSSSGNGMAKGKKGSSPVQKSSRAHSFAQQHRSMMATSSDTDSMNRMTSTSDFEEYDGGESSYGEGHGTAESGSGNGSGYGSGSGSGSGGLSGSQFGSNGDGTYTAYSADGIDYTIIREVYPDYPQRARDARYTRPVSVTARFIVDVAGNVESVEILSSSPNLGFKEATTAALYQWKFRPIVYKGYPLRVVFTKTIRFEAN